MSPWRKALVFAAFLVACSSALAANLAFADPPGGFRKGIPAFCRTGEGHPVFGWRWCMEKGFGGGRYGTPEGIPAFCRTGEGHPVFGWRWCMEKGFGGGRYREHESNPYAY